MPAGTAVRELEIANVRLIFRASRHLLPALDDLLSLAPRPTGGVADRGSIELPVELVEGPIAVEVVVPGLRVSARSSDLPAAVRGALVVALDQEGGAILHGAAVVVEGRAVLCVAPSEGGKTTLCGKVAGRLPVLSDETIALRLDGPKPRVAGTPFWSGPRLPTAEGLFPLSAICFLRKGTVGLTPLPRARALTELLHEWHLSERPGAIGEALTKAETLLSTVPTFELHSTLESDPLVLLREAAAAQTQRAG